MALLQYPPVLWYKNKDQNHARVDKDKIVSLWIGRWWIGNINNYFIIDRWTPEWKSKVRENWLRFLKFILIIMNY